MCSPMSPPSPCSLSCSTTLAICQLSYPPQSLQSCSSLRISSSSLRSWTVRSAASMWSSSQGWRSLCCYVRRNCPDVPLSEAICRDARWGRQCWQLRNLTWMPPQRSSTPSTPGYTFPCTPWQSSSTWHNHYCPCSPSRRLPQWNCCY